MAQARPDDRAVERSRHLLMHGDRLIALDEMRRISIAAKEVIEFLVADPSQDAGIGDLVAVEVQDWQNHAICRRIEELVGMPARGEGTSFGFAVADHARDDQVGVVEGSSVCMREGITQLTALVDRTGRLRRHMAGNAAGERELLEEEFHAVLVARNVRIDFAICSLEISIRHEARTAMARPGDVDHVQVVLPDDPVQVNVDEVQAWRRSPMTKQTGLDVLLA